MGTTASHPGRSAADQRYIELYKELHHHTSELVSDGEKPSDQTDQKVFKSRFINFFGGPCVVFGQLLYERLFGGKQDPVDQDSFVTTMENLARLSGGKGLTHEAEKFFFHVFSQGKEILDQKSLIEVIYVAGMFGLVVGSELHENVKIPRDHPIITSLVSAAMLVADSQSHELSATQFAVWMNEHCPKLMEGIQHWLETSLHGDHTNDSTALHTFYQLPIPHLSEEERQQDMNILVWALSTIAPLVYFGHKKDESSAQARNKHPVGGMWTLLYHSKKDGMSMNRFTSHCFDYREPSIMILTCSGPVDEEIQFVIGVDKEWRDGTHYWGGDDCFLLELQPSFTMQKVGAKLISLNEKQRGFPTGLRVMTDTNYKDCVLMVDSSLEKVTYKDGLPLDLKEIEVWGCGGQEAAESQRRLREWENKEVLRRQKIKRENLKEAWEDSPDRYILELGGVKVNNPKEQQQQ